MVDLRQTNDKIKSQLNESQQREKVLVRRLTAKEQETQDYVVSKQNKKTYYQKNINSNVLNYVVVYWF